MRPFAGFRAGGRGPTLAHVDGVACADGEIAPDPLPEPPREPDEKDFTGFVVVVLDESVPAGFADDLLAHAADNADVLAVLREFLLGNKVAASARVVRSVPPDRLDERDRTRRKAVDPLSRFWRIDVRESGIPPREFAERLLAVADSLVVHAYAETVARDPRLAITADDEPRSAEQGYKRPRPEGVDAEWAWTRLGGGGEGVGFVDVEQGWFFAHEDLADRVTATMCHRNLFDDTQEGDHGTGVLGVVFGLDNGAGGLGIASRAERVGVCSYYDGTPVHQVADAITVATEWLEAGDVLLLELERPVGLPTETDDADFAAIVAAVGKGIVVVEAAGNEHYPLDTWLSPRGRRMVRGEEAHDSGAIIVAGARSAVERDGAAAGHRWPIWASYGQRVDCHAWGENVVTAAVHEYQFDFDGSSSAAAIVAGVALALQGMHVAAHGVPLTPHEMRELLRDPGGVGQVPVASRALVPIGVMPDLKLLGERIGALPRTP